MSAGVAETIETVLRGRGGLPRRAALVVAVSGGLDSVLLLHLLHELAPAWGWRLTVAHFNHRLRGRQSGGDQLFVRRLAERLGWPCVVGGEDVQRVARLGGLSLEMAARQCRHAFLADKAIEKGCRRVVLGQHGDDQVELFFLRLLRGAGLEGLQGMRERSSSPADSRVTLLRPLLRFPREVLLGEARRRGLRWREDASNRSREPVRNRVRHELLPLMRARLQPAVVPVVLRAMELLQGEAELADWAAGQLMKRGPAYQRECLAGWGRRSVREQLIELGVEPEFGLVERLRENPGQPWSVGAGRALRFNKAGRVEWVSAEEQTFSDARVGICFQGCEGVAGLMGRRVRWRVVARDRGDSWRRWGGERREVFDADRMGEGMVLRFWAAGDRFEPSGLGEQAKLQDLFGAAKVPREERKRCLVGTTASGELFWVEGLRIGERFKVGRSTRRFLLWEWDERQVALAKGR